MLYKTTGTNPATALSATTIQENLKVIVVNWRLPADTLECVASLRRAGVAPEAIIVIDNGSADNSAAHLAAGLEPGIALRPLPHNLGFAGGNNVGIREALESGAEWLWLLNNDTVVSADLLTVLAETTASFPAYHLLSPLIVWYDQPDQVWSVGDVRRMGTLLTRGILKDRSIPPKLPPIIPVDFLTACSLFVHRSVFTTIGLLDENYFMYGEDNDFCQRASLHGYRLACMTRGRVQHKVSRSTHKKNLDRLVLKLQHQIRFYRRYASRPQQLLLALFTLTRAVQQTLRNQAGTAPLVRDPALLHAWWHSWRAPR